MGTLHSLSFVLILTLINVMENMNSSNIMIIKT